jgi:hypothetical protein
VGSAPLRNIERLDHCITETSRITKREACLLPERRVITMTILVTYASKHGSTRGIAEHMAE